MRDLARGEVTTKFVAASCRAIGLGLRAAEFEYKRGNGGSVVLVDKDNCLDRRERELMEQLAQVRGQRASQ